MRIHFLGTGPAISIPRKAHRDPTCRDARRGGKSRRGRSCAIVSNQAINVLLDAGPDIVKQLKKAEWPKIDAIMLTHAHQDAVGGLELLARHLKKEFRPILVYAQKKTIKQIVSDVILKTFKLRPLQNYRPFRVKEMTIIPFTVQHVKDPRFPTNGFLFDRRLAYASDVGRLPNRTKHLLHNVATLVLDGALWFGASFKNHLTPDRAVAYAKEIRTKRLILTQIGHGYPPHKEAQRKIRAYSHSLPMACPKRIDLAWDGWRVKI